ncbi:MAG: hypothetical protein HGA74_16085, partial [Deltaproteobacteria bacterium]|nr:hypothetical protein [Deltaproteobacteria bacterium]
MILEKDSNTAFSRREEAKKEQAPLFQEGPGLDDALLVIGPQHPVHAFEIGEMTLNPAEENSCQDVTQKKEKEIIDFPSYPRDWESDLRESFLHPGQCKKDGPEGGCGKPELVE